MTTLASDNFNRANGALGANWTVTSGSLPYTIVSQQCTPGDGSLDADMIYSGITWPNDQWCQFTVVSLTGSSGNQGLGLALRGSSAAATWYRCAVNGDASVNWFISSFKAGAYGDRHATGTQAVAAGDIIYAEIQGNTIVMKWAAAATPTVFSTVVTYTDSSSPITTGSPGLTYSSQTTTKILDDWVGGDFAAAVTWEQEGYRWRNDDGSEVTATYIGAQDTPL